MVESANSGSHESHTIFIKTLESYIKFILTNFMI